MIKKEKYLKDIGSSLAKLKAEVEIFNSVNLYDINNFAEDFYAGLLNLIYGYNLKNLNILEKNTPAIDLGDEENRISIQVTSDNSSEKIKETISKFIKKKSYLKYDRLIILILTAKRKYTTVFNTRNKFNFNCTKDVIDCTDLMKTIRGKNIKELKDLNKFLIEEFYDKLPKAKSTHANEIDTIMDLIEYITKNKNKKLKNNVDAVIDPDYKINKRFKNFAEKIKSHYTSLYTVYGDTLNIINETREIDEAQALIKTMYLQDISIKYLDDTKDNPMKALDRLVNYFEDQLSTNGKEYDKYAIKFYLVSEIIECNVFPNERENYNVNKQ